MTYYTHFISTGQQKKVMRTDLHVNHQFLGGISKFKMSVKNQFQTMQDAEGNFFDLYFGCSDSDSEFKGFVAENIVPL